jgi:hypothetical protein
MILTKSEIEALTNAQAVKCLRALNKQYKLDQEITTASPLWPQVDDIANCLLYLEDQIARTSNEETT